MESLSKGLHPKVVNAVQSMLTEAKARKLNIGLHYGLRTPDEQQALYEQGRSKPGQIVTNAQAWESWHCYGLAVDVVFKDKNDTWTWSVPKEQWEELGKIGEIFAGFEWGGRWKNFPDYPHFQMRGKFKSIKEAKRILLEKGIDAVWALV